MSIHTKDGREIVGKFKERTGLFVVLADGRRIRAGSIKSFVIVKGGI